MTFLDKLGALFGDGAEHDYGVAPEAAPPGSEYETAREALRTVIDPELGLNIIDLGLVYGMKIDSREIYVALTMTTPACPLGDLIQAHARRAIEHALPDREIEIELVWQPPWTSDRMSREARQMLGLE